MILSADMRIPLILDTKNNCPMTVSRF